MVEYLDKDFQHVRERNIGRTPYNLVDMVDNFVAHNLDETLDEAFLKICEKSFKNFQKFSNFFLKI